VLFEDIENFKRHIGSVGSGNGPTVLVTAGLHGNEPSGVEACRRILPELQQTLLQGKVVCLAGNLKALDQGKRMLMHDLNRVWQAERVERDAADGPQPELGQEADELHGINKEVQALLRSEESIILLDLHTTSAQTVPFLTMCDTLVNREFVQRLGVPVVIGIEEYLSGPLLSYVMEQGFPAMAFESGCHSDPNSADRHYHFLWLALEKAGLLKLDDLSRTHHLKNISFSDSLSGAVFDVRHREEIPEHATVKVLPGFRNFDVIKRGQKLAQTETGFITSDRDCRIFMPLYQAQGTDAYFLIGRMPKWWKLASRFSRKNQLHRFMALFPGVKRIGDKLLLVKPRIARGRIKHLLHLVGYRFLQDRQDALVYILREV